VDQQSARLVRTGRPLAEAIGDEIAREGGDYCGGCPDASDHWQIGCEDNRRPTAAACRARSTADTCSTYESGIRLTSAKQTLEHG
jgi:hypothetical protein